MDKKRRKSRSKKRTRTKRSHRERLEKATANYFASLSGEALKEENELAAAVGHAASRVNFDE